MTDQLNFFEEKPLSRTGLDEIRHMVEKYADLRKEKDAIEDALSDKNKEIAEMSAKILSILSASNYKTLPIDGVGTVTRKERFQVSFPKDAAAAAKLREFFLAQGMGSELTVNHNRLNSIYESLKEARKAEGNLSLEDIIPGVAEPVIHETLSFTKKGK